MKFHLDRELRLHTEPEHKTLYRWAINEIDAQGQKIGSDQIPWEWSLYFTATSCVLSDSIEISQPLNFKFKATNQDGTVTEQKSSDGKETIDQRQIIRVRLRSGDEDNSRHTTYSMFGTDRTIKDIRLDINQLTDPAEPERCIAWGCVSYTSEGVDFIDETTDDCIVFYFSVKPETFARYAAKIAHGSVDGIVLRVKSVDGFYSDWSPSVRTDKVMVLTRDDEHKVTAPSDTQLVPPRLGRVGDAALFINRRLEFGIQASEPMPDDREPKVLREKMRAVRETPAQTVVDQQMLPMLRSLRRATWFVVCLLALMFIVTLLRH